MVVRAGHCEGCTKRVHSVTRVPVHRVPRFLGDPTAASVRPTGILTCVGSVLRQWRLLLSSASPPSPPPCPPPSRLCLSSPSPSTLPPISFSLFLRLPRSLSYSFSLRSSHPFALSLLLPSLPRCHGFRSAAYLCRYTTASSTPFSLLFLLTVLLRVTLLLRATTTTITSPPPPPFPPSASWPSPPAESTCSLPHYLSNPALLSTNDQPLSLHRVPLFLRERNLSFLRSRAPLLSNPPSSRSYCSLAYERTKMKLFVLVSLRRSIPKDSW